MFLQKDNFRLGIVLGFLAPFLGMVCYYLARFYPTFSVGDYLHVLATQKSLITALLSVSLVANAVILTIYNNTNRNRTARGIFAATCVYAIVTLVIKYLL